MEWKDRTTVKKGDLGESIVDAFLESRGLVIYDPKTPGAHPFDRICATRDKRYICVVDVKSKPARIYYPDTGIDKKHFDEYLHIQETHSIDVWLFFVDEIRKQIYGQKMKTLAQPRIIEHNGRNLSYPWEAGKIIYFPLAAMSVIAKITQDEADALLRLSTRTYLYPEEAK